MAVKKQNKKVVEENMQQIAMPSELELTGLSEAYLLGQTELVRYEILEDAGLDPEEYAHLFKDFEWLSDNLTCYRKLAECNIDADEFLNKNDDEKLQLLIECNLNPYDYDVFFKDWIEILRKYNRKLMFDNYGIDYNWFHSLSDIERVEKIVMKGLDPVDFVDEYDDFQTALQKADEIRILSNSGISYFSFLWKPDEEKLDDLMRADLAPYGFQTYFDDPAKAEREYERRRALKRRSPAITEAYLSDMEDVERAEVLLKAGLIPGDYKELFKNYDALEEELPDIEDKVYSRK